MKRHYGFFIALALIVMSIGAVPASAQNAEGGTMLLNVDQDVPLAATLDNPCTSTLEAIVFTGTMHLSQQVYSMPSGTTRLAVAESLNLTGTDTTPLLVSPTYTAGGSNNVDVEFWPGSASLYNYHQVTSTATQDNFHVVVNLDFDPLSLKLSASLGAACSDGTTQ